MDISSIQAMANQYTTDTSSTAKLESSLNSDYSNATGEELMDVCKEFETYFTEQVFKAMQKMVPNSEETSSNQYMEMFNDNLIKEYAASATSQNEGLGIAKMLYEQMKRNYGVDTVPAVDITEVAEAVDISDKVKEIN